MKNTGPILLARLAAPTMPSCRQHALEGGGWIAGVEPISQPSSRGVVTAVPHIIILVWHFWPFGCGISCL